MKLNLDLLQIIKASSLNTDEQLDFIEIIMDIDDAEQSILFDFFSKDPALVKVMYTNYQDKVKALNSKNINDLKAVLAREEELLA